jgi:hypothetical protein
MLLYAKFMALMNGKSVQGKQFNHPYLTFRRPPYILTGIIYCYQIGLDYDPLLSPILLLLEISSYAS